MKRKPWDARLASWLISPFILSDVVQPNHFTTIRLITGIAAAVLFALGTYLNIAALLIVISNFLDHADGELARQGNKSSQFGHIYETSNFSNLNQHRQILIDYYQLASSLNLQYK